MSNLFLGTHWTHDLSPFLFQFPEGIPLVGGFGLRYYGLAYMLGTLIGFFLLLFYYKKQKSPYNSSQITDLVTFLIAGVIIGGRLGYMLLYDFESFAQNPLIFFQFWKGGMASHGGMLGVMVAVIWYAKLQKQSILETGDLIVTIAAPGLFLGRTANFINGELWGQKSEVPWAVIFPEAGPNPRHPSQLYEALGEGLFLFIYIQLRFWGKLGKRPPFGQLVGEFLVFYSVARIVCEVFREPDAPLIYDISRGQFYSIATFLGGIGFILFARIQANRKNRKQN
ncbi:MAG: prolipoprotein diacylglyceryl transferase [Opitutales bacterium]|nr:prolipoprotein diacylglyceryl transferase [Opitutales bacterium]